MNETFSQKAPSISNEIAWEVIMDSIQDSKAILIIGGEIFNHNGKNLDVLLREAVGSHAKAYADGLFHFKGGGLILSYSAIKRFYNQSFEHVSKVLDKITQIPFHIIFSATPDDQIRQAFIRQKLPFSYDFYFKRQPAKAMPEITASKPLLYNLFGDLKERNSLVLTYDDLFDYFTSTSEGNSMSSLLKSEIRGANNFIFIGLPFDKWYVRLLLRVLEQHTQESKSL